MKKSKTLLFLTIVLLSSCSSDDDIDQESLLPPITTTGENTFGCLIDGNFFKPRDGRWSVAGPSPGLIVWSSESTNVEYDINDYKSERTGSLLIHIENIIRNSEQIYFLDKSNGLRGLDGRNNHYAHGRFWNSEKNRYQIYHSYDGSGYVSTKNTLILNRSNIYSSTFEFKMVNTSDFTDTLYITKGRFDVDNFTIEYKRWN